MFFQYQGENEEKIGMSKALIHNTSAFNVAKVVQTIFQSSDNFFLNFEQYIKF